MSGGASIVRVSLCAVAVGGVLAGCTDAGGATPDSSPVVVVVESPAPTRASSTPTVAAEPSPTAEPVTAPPRPAEMDRSDEVGAAAAAEYFMRLQTYALRSGDLTEWDARSGDDCRFCANVSGAVAGVYGAGGRYTGFDMAIDGVEVLGQDTTVGVFSVEVRFTMEGGDQLDAAGARLTSFAPDVGTVVLDLVPSPQGWILAGGDSQADEQ